MGGSLNRREVYVFVVLLCLVYLLGICPNVLGKLFNILLKLTKYKNNIFLVNK